MDRATAKQPEDRYPDMTEFLRDLEGALEVEVSRAGGATGEATAVLRSVPAADRRLMTGRRWTWVGVAVLVAAAATAIAIAAFSGDETRRDRPPRPPEPTAATIELVGSEDFDPLGDDIEHDDEVELAIDDDPDTAWTTETYSAGLEGAPKEGVGLIVEAAEPVEASSLQLQTDGGGWRFDVYGSADGSPPAEAPFDEFGDETGAWGDALALDATADADTEVELDSPAANQFFLIWITSLEGTPAAEINGVQLSS